MALHKTISQNLRVSLKNPFDWKFLKIGSVIVYSFVRNIRNLQICRLTPVPLTALTIKDVFYVPKQAALVKIKILSKYQCNPFKIIGKFFYRVHLMFGSSVTEPAPRSFW